MIGVTSAIFQRGLMLSPTIHKFSRLSRDVADFAAQITARLPFDKLTSGSAMVCVLEVRCSVLPEAAAAEPRDFFPCIYVAKKIAHTSDSFIYLITRPFIRRTREDGV
jgi:hypothetical protein